MADQTLRLVPAIRFTGFSAAWNPETYGNILSVKHGFAFKGKHFGSRGRYIVLTPGNFVEDGGFRYQGAKEKFYTTEEFPHEYVLSKGDLVVVMTEQADGLIGTPLLVPKNDLFLHNQRLGLFEAIRELSNGFLFHQCCTPKSKRAFSLTAAGTKVRHTSPEKIKKLVIAIPDPPEQKQIASFLTSLDWLIELHQQKYDKLATLKQAMLQKLFPQEGATFPEIRFRKIEGVWEEKQLCEIAEFNPKASLPAVFQYVDLESVVGTELVRHRTESRETAPSRAQRLARTGDIFFQTVRPYQRNNYLFRSNRNDFVFSTGYAQIRPFSNGDFLLAAMQRNEFVKVVLQNCTGTSYPAINANVLSKIQIRVPLPDEQEKIGTYFRILDNLTSKHAMQLLKLKNIKSACLEKMFL